MPVSYRIPAAAAPPGQPWLVRWVGASLEFGGYMVKVKHRMIANYVKWNKNDFDG